MRRWRSGKNGKAAKQQSSRAAEKWRNSKGKVRPTRAVDDALAGRNPRYGVLRITGDLKRKLKSKGGRKSLSGGQTSLPCGPDLKTRAVARSQTPVELRTQRGILRSCKELSI